MTKAEPQYETIKAMVLSLAVETTGTDYEGRPVGLPYAEIMRRVRKAFPVIRYCGPHQGKKIRLSQKQLRECIYKERSDRRELGDESFFVLPRRPRKPRGSKRPRSTGRKPS